MTGRVWGLSRRQTIGVIAVAVVVGVAIGVVLGPSDRGSDEPTRAVPEVERVEPGTSGAANAVWVFGFETLRFDERLENAEQLSVRGFGSVHGAEGEVYMFDPGTGRVGRLDARQNLLRVLTQVAPGTAEPDAFLPSTARADSTLWLVSDPGIVTPLDLETMQVGQPVAVASYAAAELEARATAVVSGPGGVFTATATPGGIEVAKVDTSTGTVVATSRVPGPQAPSSLDGFAAGAAQVWLLSEGQLHTFDPATLVHTRSDAIESRAHAGARGLAAAGGDAWTLTDGGATLTRYRPSTGKSSRALRILGEAPVELRLPASLVSDGRRVWAMVRRGGNAADLTVRIVGFDAGRGVSTKAVDVPGRIAPGALATS